MTTRGSVEGVHGSMDGGLSSVDGGRLDAAFELVEGHVREGRIPGAVLGIARSGGDLRTEAFSPPGGPEITVESRFLVASDPDPLSGREVRRRWRNGRCPSHRPSAVTAPGEVRSIR